MNGEFIGASIEAGGKVWDPLGLLVIHKINPGFLPHAKWWAESEIKHCRIAMLASVGAFSAQYGLTIPGYTSVADPIENLSKYIVDYPLGFSQIILAIGVIEGKFYPGEFWFGKGDRVAGELGYDPLGISRNKSQAQKDSLRLAEIKNGRLAMMAMAAYASEHLLPGSVPFLPGKF